MRSRHCSTVPTSVSRANSSSGTPSSAPPGVHARSALVALGQVLLVLPDQRVQADRQANRGGVAALLLRRSARRADARSACPRASISTPRSIPSACRATRRRAGARPCRRSRWAVRRPSAGRGWLYARDEPDVRTVEVDRLLAAEQRGDRRDVLLQHARTGPRPIRTGSRTPRTRARTTRPRARGRTGRRSRWSMRGRHLRDDGRVAERRAAHERPQPHPPACGPRAPPAP